MMRAGFSIRTWGRRGATVVEYLIAVILVVLVAMGIVKLFGSTLYDKYSMGEERIREVDSSRPGEDDDPDEPGSPVAGDAQGSDRLTSKEESGAGSGSGGRRASGGVYSRTQGEGVERAGGSGGLEDEERDGEQGAGRRASQRGYALKSEVEEKERRARRRKKEMRAGLDDRRYQAPTRTPDAEVEFNPFILIIVGLAVAGLLFIVVKGNDESD